MAWTPTTFKAARPVFTATSDAIVQQALNDALPQCDVRVFGASQDAAVSLYAAHLLSIDPYGQPARLDTKDKASATTTYLDEWNRLAQRRGGGGWTAGQWPGTPPFRYSP